MQEIFHLPVESIQCPWQYFCHIIHIILTILPYFSSYIYIYSTCMYVDFPRLYMESSYGIQHTELTIIILSIRKNGLPFCVIAIGNEKFFDKMMKEKKILRIISSTTLGIQSFHILHYIHILFYTRKIMFLAKILNNASFLLFLLPQNR